VEELDVNKKCKLVYGRDIKDSHNSTVGALLFYNSSHKDAPFATIFYWEYNKDFKKMTIDFTSEIYGKDKIEQYWKEILELDKNKILKIDTLCDTIDSVLFGKEKQIELENKVKVNWTSSLKDILCHIVPIKRFKK